MTKEGGKGRGEGVELTLTQSMVQTHSLFIYPKIIIYRDIVNYQIFR